MAIVIPAAIEGLRVASLAGTVAARKRRSRPRGATPAERESVTTNWNQSAQSGTLTEGQRQYRWTMRTDPWTQDPNVTLILQLSAEVFFKAQNRDYSVRLSTLVDSSQQQH